jgi:Ca-activated chloride channel family protein
MPDGHPGFGVVKVRTAVSVRVTGRIARVEVEEWFRNDGRGLGEGDYLYPLPGEAVFSNFSLFQGDQELRGETMDADRARTIYEEIVRRKRDPALIELAGHGLIRARVFPINHGETRKITLRYTQVLERSGDALQFRYAAGGRYSHRPVEQLDRPIRRPSSSVPLTFRLVADNGSAYRDPFSPTHRVRVSREDGRLVVQPEGTLTGDFTLFLPFAESLVGITVATHRPAGEDGYFMLTLSPGRVEGSSQPRDVTVVVDVSGSMSGMKIEQAKSALRQLLGSLGSQDRYRLLAFSNTVAAQSQGWARPTRDQLQRARRWIDRLQADGGTNIAGALEEAFRLESAARRLPIVMFLTDGLPSVGERDPERIAEWAETHRGTVRVFAFGVGHDVNTYLLDRLSAAGRGTTEYVEPGEDVEQALSLLAAKIQHPVLTDLEIRDAPVSLLEIYPSVLPDLFAGEELVVFGRYRPTRRTHRGDVVVGGQRNGRGESYSASAAFPEHELGNDYIPRLWASRKIGVLAREIRLNGPNDELMDEIRRTALRYGLLSEYTSYLVQEPTDMANVPMGDRRNRDSGVSALASPSAQVGAVAVAAAEQARSRREAKSQMEVDAANEALLLRGHVAQTRHVAGRLFKEADGVWVDLHHKNTTQTVRVEPFSQAYFGVLRALPELESYLREFERVIVAGERVSIEVASGGVETLSARRLQRLVREFRTR